MSVTIHKVGTTFRTKSGRARATYRPDYDKSKPWITYIDGEAGYHFATLQDAVRYLRLEKGLVLITETT